MSQSPIVFLHGGPGFNSRAEEAVLGLPINQKGCKAIFWNEPLVPNPSFSSSLADVQNCLADAVKRFGPVHLVAHSFALQWALRMANERPEWIAKMTLISPVTNLNSLYRNVMAIALADLEKTDVESANALRANLANSKTFFDHPMQDGFRQVEKDQALLMNYFFDQSALAKFVEVWVKNGLKPNAELFFGVLSELKNMPALEPMRSAISTQIIWGKHDRVSKRESQFPQAKKLIPHANLIEFENSAHYPHLEEVERFISLL